MSLGLPAVQRKEADELKATLAKQTEEHNGKEKRLRLTVHILTLICFPEIPALWFAPTLQQT